MSDTSLPEVPRQTTALRRGLKPIAVFGTMFFLASGGPYGVELLVPLPPQVIYSMSLGVVVRLVAGGSTLSDAELDTLVASTWRAITVPG